MTTAMDINALENRLEHMKDPRARRGMLDSFYATLKHSATALPIDAAHVAVGLLRKYGFTSHADKIDPSFKNKVYVGGSVEDDVRLPRVYVEPPLSDQGKRIRNEIGYLDTFFIPSGDPRDRQWARDARGKVIAYLSANKLPHPSSAEVDAMSGNLQNVYHAALGYLGRVFPADPRGSPS